ncbi:thiamine-phosphate kinase [Vibrio sp. 404]|uniref:Thiamine-monophosphate kinase n=1 Tax=Vibrio marinisediminis TaxID=2758441 RepID=A0A7W2FSA4_9VIBR|nr:thiamine-phosphate kinase [Vibrio marinisediminis]MBA5763346.1 thiamine-phosphate kinase [Vibrio marinisediminis]
MSGEFNLIETYFVGRQTQRCDVLLAAGDDCALVEAPSGYSIAISTDTLVSGTHFLANANPGWVAHKALASNISDLAAMGATPAWVSFALTMPEVDEEWLAPFCDRFFALADQYGIQLIGGDTTKGPLSLTLTVQGLVPKGEALRRDGAKEGDEIYVTGSLGDSQAGLDVILNPTNAGKPNARVLEQRHYLSSPRIKVGEALRGIASAAIDISDGVVSDLGHILKRSSVGAEVDVEKLPVSAQLVEFVASRESALQYALISGEEYELCFTVPEAKREAMWQALADVDCVITRIGQINNSGTLTLTKDGQAISWQLSGYDHFKSN